MTTVCFTLDQTYEAALKGAEKRGDKKQVEALKKTLAERKAKR